jgi:hypothetical protein
MMERRTFLGGLLAALATAGPAAANGLEQVTDCSLSDRNFDLAILKLWSRVATQQPDQPEDEWVAKSKALHSVLVWDIVAAVCRINGDGRAYDARGMIVPGCSTQDMIDLQPHKGNAEFTLRCGMK